MSADQQPQDPQPIMRRLPTELQQEVFLRHLDPRYAYSPFYLKGLVFGNGPQSIKNNRYGVTIARLIRYFYGGDAMSTFSRPYCFAELFHDCTMNQFRQACGSWNNRFANERSIRGHIAMHYSVINMPVGVVDVPPDFWWLHYICEVHIEEKHIMFTLWELSDHDPARVNFRDFPQFNLFPLFRFLTESSNFQTPNQLQARYNYLGSLEPAKRKLIDDSLNAMVSIIRHRHSHEMPWYGLREGAANYRLNRLSGLVPDVYANGAGLPGLPWEDFTASGAWDIVVKHTILSLNANECALDDMLRTTPLRTSLPGQAAHQELWHFEMLRSGQKTVLAPTLVPVTEENPIAYIRLEGQAPPPATMAEFIHLNPLWAWEKALQLPRAECLPVSGPAPNLSEGIIRVLLPDYVGSE